MGFFNTDFRFVICDPNVYLVIRINPSKSKMLKSLEFGKKYAKAEKI